jgi:uncharacterized lipoprotein YmbA
MMKSAPFVCLPVILAMLASCGHSPPTQFFTLDPAPPRHAEAVAPTGQLQLGAVRIPPALDRPELVTHSEANRLIVQERNQWAAPLGDTIRQTLARDLFERLPPGSFVAPDAPAPAAAQIISVDILSLEAHPDGSVNCELSWSLLGPDGKLLRTRNLHLTAPGRAVPGGQAEAISTILGELADSIVNDVAH